MPKHLYEIRVDGRLGSNWGNWFETLTIQNLECSQTLLTGLLDQAMLRGVLTKICDLGLKIISVQLLEQDNKEK